MIILYIAKHVVALAAVVLAAMGAGTLATGRRGGFALRSALGLAVMAQAFFLLALAGALRPVPIAILTMIAIGGNASVWPRASARGPAPSAVITFISSALLLATFLLALRPPLAFDETLYHLPFVRALAESGRLGFLVDFRFPVFPQLNELLCVPLFLAAGDVATHLISLTEVLMTVGLLLEWGKRYGSRTGLLAAASFAGSPIVMQLATIGYVDAGLTLFLTAGFYCLDRAQFTDRRWLVLSGFFFGTASSVKYIGWFFAAAAFALVALLSLKRRRETLVFAASCVLAALPTTLWLLVNTHNPVFPFLPRVFGATPWSIPLASVPLGTRLARTVMLVWNVTFAREHVNAQPPVTPFLVILIIVVIAAAMRDVRAGSVAIIAVVYVIVFSFLPQDSRYLVPLLPLLCITAAAAITARWPKGTSWLALIAIGPAILYAGYALVTRGLPPSTPAEREAMLTQRVPEYAALAHAGKDTVYVCGGEQLKYYAGAELLGDFFGPCSYDRVLSGPNATSAIAQSLRRIGARDFLVAKRVCPPPRADGGMDLVFEDAGAQLWQIPATKAVPIFDKAPRVRVPRPPVSSQRLAPVPAALPTASDR